MSRAGVFRAGPSPGAWDPAPSDWTVRPRYSAADFVTLLWRERFVMLAIFAALFLLGAAFAFTRPTTYPSRASLIVSLGQEYVYEPRVGDAGRGAVPESDLVVQSEVEILSSAQLRARVVERIGVARLYPDLAEEYGARPGIMQRREMVRRAAEAMGRKLSVSTAPDQPAIRLAFEHESPEVSADVVNQLVREYLVYRREILRDTTSPLLGEQRRRFQEQLASADAEYGAFLSANQIGDFPTERQALNARYAAAVDERYRVDARLEEVAARLAAITSDMGRLSPEIGISRDVNTTAADRLLQLRIDRENLLGRYRPEAQPVRDIDAQIAQLERMIGEGRGAGEGARRFGVNPVHQTLQTEQLQLQAESASLRARRAELEQQIRAVTDRQLRMAELEPAYQDLVLRREVLQQNVRNFTIREQESRAEQAIASRVDDNVRVVEWAVPSSEGSSLTFPLLVLSVLFAGFTALCAALARIFLRRGFATPSSAARTLDLPVLAAAPVKAA